MVQPSYVGEERREEEDRGERPRVVYLFGMGGRRGKIYFSFSLFLDRIFHHLRISTFMECYFFVAFADTILCLGFWKDVLSLANFLPWGHFPPSLMRLLHSMRYGKGGGNKKQEPLP